MYITGKKYSKQSGSDLFTSGMFWLKRKNSEAALQNLLECHQLGFRKKEIENIIFEDCYVPYKNQHEQNYLKNVSLLRSYPYVFDHDYPDFDNLKYQFIPFSASCFIIYNRESGVFSSDFCLKERRDLSMHKVNDVIMINNEFWPDNIMAFEKKTREPAPYLWSKIPLFLFYRDFNEFVQYLQVFDFSSVLESERLVIIFGFEELKQYYSDPQALFPSLIVNVRGDSDEEVVQFITEQVALTKKESSILKERIEHYYATISPKDLLERIQSKNPRILFVTSRFTTALQYSMRDCAQACLRLGIPNKVLIESSDVHRIGLYAYLKVIADFKPDIIFLIDHFRWESPFLPDNVIVTTWVQDILPHIASHESGARIGPLDFVLNAFFSNTQFLLDCGYPNGAIIEAPVVANPNIYKKYYLEKEEKERYGTDICAFSNTGNPQKGLKSFLTLINTSSVYDDLEKIFSLAYCDMYESFYNENIFYSLEEYRKFLIRYLENYGLSIPEDTLDILAREWRQEVGYRILRSIPLEWLHEKGYAMKLWGSEWTDHPLLADYAQGVAANGETLSRIINACKIVIGTNPGITTHPRVGETILSNSFYLAYRIPPEYDWANIRRYLKEDQEIIFAYNREDLCQKVDYYLENEAARRKIIYSSKERILEELTHEALISRVLQEIALKLEKLRNGVQS